jgi:hypothetical protein
MQTGSYFFQNLSKGRLQVAKRNGMIDSKIVLACVIFACSLMILPNVQAQTTTITEFHYPSYADAGSPNPFSVTATISYQDANSSNSLVIGIFDVSSSQIISGIATASPDQCVDQHVLLAFCAVRLIGSTGMEHFEFKIGGILGEHHEFGDWNLNMTTAIITPSNIVVEGSRSSMLFTVTLSPLVLTVNVPPSVVVSVDGIGHAPGPVQTPLTVGSHNITVATLAPVDDTTRLRFEQWTDGVVQANRSISLQFSETLEAVYTVQYRLDLMGQQPNSTGAGWYDAGSPATVSVDNVEPMSGVLGLLGGKLKFHAWYENGVLLTDSPVETITINRPRVLIAQWQADYTMPLAITGALILVIGFALFVLRRRNAAIASKTQKSAASGGRGAKRKVKRKPRRNVTRR